MSGDSLREALSEKALRILEFDSVRASLASLTSFPPSGELAVALVPSNTYAEALHLQQETRDATRLLEMRPNFSLDGAKDIRRTAQAAALGGSITGPELLEIAETLAVVHFLRAALVRAGESLYVLGALGAELAECREVESAIRRMVNPHGEVVDSASERLQRLRREEKATQQRLMARLQEIVASPLGRQVLQEPFLTTRDERYVLAVKAEMRGQIQGLIHDISSSGATVFMEPLATVELGNAWRELRLAERKEVERILRELTALVGSRGDAIQESLRVMARVDLALAKARLASSMHAALPKLLDPAAHQSQSSVLLREARHPLLKGDVVPISAEIGTDFRALVISGPNTGGKTVTLKTIGLLALMAQAGLAVPAEEGSALRVFDGVYADVGDEQSIQQSLSTFSSHMGNIVQILNVATGRSLVLLDELGAGTDPQDGTAIARAVLSKLVRDETTSVVTTHHSELKAFAHSTPVIENASVEFDPISLSPTYRLIVGVPGRSNALAIAERLGLPKGMVAEARASMGATEAEVESLLSTIQEERRRAEAEREAAERAHRELEEAQAHLKARTDELEEGEHRLAMVRRAEVQVLAEELKSRLRHISRRINALVSEQGRQEWGAIQKEMAEVNRQLDGPEWPVHPKREKPHELIAPGDRVNVEELKPAAEVLSGPDKKQMMDVQVGPVRLRLHRDRIKGKDHRPAPPERGVTVSEGVAARAQVGPEFWVHGMRAKQAVAAVDEYLEKAAMAGHARVRIIHGKGKWILRSAIQQALGDHPLVGLFKDADAEEGGQGVTIVEL